MAECIGARASTVDSTWFPLGVYRPRREVLALALSCGRARIQPLQVAEIKIATLDHLGDIFLVLSQYRHVVVDEADCVGHLEFEADPILILDQLTTETIEERLKRADIYMPATLVKLASAESSTVETPVVSGVSRLVYILSQNA